MARKNDLKAVIRLHRFRLDEMRRAQAELFAREDELLELQRRLAEEVERETAITAAHHLEGGRTFGAFARRAKEREDALERGLVIVRDEIEALRQRLIDGFKELKTFEIAEENRQAQEKAEAEHREQIVLDEIGLTLHRRRRRAG